MIKMLKNPFYVYIIGFGMAFIIYGFGWSELYPELSKEMKWFLYITFLFFFIFGYIINKLNLIKKTPSRTSPSLVYKLFYILIVLYGIEFIVEGNIPLLSKLLGQEGVYYQDFGIPMLHGILISFNSFIIAHVFSVYMSTKSKKMLRFYFFLYIPALFFLSRSIIVIGALSSVFIYIHYSGKIKIKSIFYLGLLALVGLFMFGVLGNLRSGGDYFYVQSKAKKTFMDSSMPKEFYWTYIYAASPLANFQNTTIKKKVNDFDFTGFFFYECIPKIITKNFGVVLDIDERDLVRIVPWLTVGTAYGKSFAYLGWLGPYMMFIISIISYLTIIIFFVPRASNYHITTISILSVIILLNIFSNILVVTGISFQLIYCLIFAYFENKKFVLKK